MNVALINPPQQPNLDTFFEIGIRARMEQELRKMAEDEMRKEKE